MTEILFVTRDELDAAVDTEDHASEIEFTPAGSIAATDVQAAIEELDADITALTAADIANVPAGSIEATDVQAAIAELDAEKQPLDADLTTIAGLTATTNNFIVSVASAWASRTPAQVLATLAAVGTTFQPLDADLTTIAGLTATTDNFMIAASSAWASRTPAQAKTSLGLATSSTDNAIVRFDSTAGNQQNSVVTVSDSGTVTAPDGFKGLFASIADDAVLSFTAPGLFTITRMMITSGVSAYSGLVYCRAGASPSTILETTVSSTSINVTTGILTGTTGSDAKLTVSTHTDGKIYVENRLGGSVNFTFAFFPLTT